MVAKRVIARFAEIVAALVFGASLGFAPEARALSPYLEIPDRDEVVKTPSYRYANMTNDEAFAELDRRGILYTREKDIPGVRAPIRLTGRLHGVLIRSALPPAERATTTCEILDARLALSLDDFSEILAKHDVDEVVHYTMYRPNVAKPDDEDAEGGDDAHPAAHPVKGHSRGGAHHEHHAAHPAKTPAPGNGVPKEAAAKDAPPADKAAKPQKRGVEPHASGKKKKTLGADADRKGLAGLDDADAGELPRESFDLTNAGELGAKAARAKKKRSAVGASPTVRNKATAKANETPPAHAKTASAPATPFVKPPPKWAPPGTRHPAGLAIDVGVLKKKDGTQLSIAADFDGNIGDQTCGAGAPSPSRPAARELREIVCEARREGVFTYTLTPNFDIAHRDHFHMEIKPGVYWFLYN